MLVISDASPLNVLIRIELARILPDLYGEVTIPDVVESELTDPRAPQIVREFMAASPPWLTIRNPQSIGRFPRLGAGESAAISLALELHADILLVDDRRARSTATHAGLSIIGTLGVLEVAARLGRLNLKAALERLRETDFRLSDHLLAEALARAKKDE